MEKVLNNNSINMFREIYALYHQQKIDEDELSELIKNNTDILAALSIVSPWAYFYDLSYVTFLAYHILAFNLTDIIRTIANSENHAQALIDFASNLPDTSSEDESLSDEEKGNRFALTMAITYQRSSIAIFSQSLNHLVEKARDGDDDALFNAVLVDRSVVSTPSVARRIQIAQLTEDNSFMDKLAKAITKTKPRRPAEKHDDLRYMLEVLDEEIGLENITHEKLYDTLSDGLELYSGSTDGLMKLIQRRNQKLRT